MATDHCREDAHVVVLVEVPGDHVGAGVVTRTSQLVAQPDDQLNHLRECHVRAAQRPSRPGSKDSLTPGPIAGNTLEHPTLRDTVVAGDISLGSSLKHNNGDNQASSQHSPNVTEKFPTSREMRFLYPERTHQQPDKAGSC